MPADAASGSCCWKRTIFLPSHEYTLIGTTDSDHNASLDRVRASSDEVAHSCESASTYCRRAICPNDVVWSYSGVRLLLHEGVGAAQAATPDYKLDLETDGGAALLAVLGGKITTYRQLAEQALALLEPDKRIVFAIPYEGGDFAIDGAEQLVITGQHPRFDAGIWNDGKLVWHTGRSSTIRGPGCNLVRDSAAVCVAEARFWFEGMGDTAGTSSGAAGSSVCT